MLQYCSTKSNRDPCDDEIHRDLNGVDLPSVDLRWRRHSQTARSQLHQMTRSGTPLGPLQFQNNQLNSPAHGKSASKKVTSESRDDMVAFVRGSAHGFYHAQGLPPAFPELMGDASAARLAISQMHFGTTDIASATASHGSDETLSGTPSRASGESTRASPGWRWQQAFERVARAWNIDKSESGTPANGYESSPSYQMSVEVNEIKSVVS